MKRYISMLIIFVVSLSLSGCKGRLMQAPAEYTPLSTAEFPKDPPYPTDEMSQDFDEKYSEYAKVVKQRRDLEVDTNGIDEYVKSTILALSQDKDKNVVYSPANLYFALSMLAECTNGSSRDEILKALGHENIDTLRKNANNLWQKLYSDNGVYTSVMANSIWLKDGIKYNNDTLDILKDSHYASAFSGDFLNEGYASAVREWINKNTKDLLKDQTQNIKFDDETVAALVSTIYFNAKWNEEFDENLTQKGDFNSPTGKVKTDFMKRSHSQVYYYADGYSATTLYFDQDSAMHFILPDEDTSVYDIITKEGVLDIINGRADAYEYEGEAKKDYLIVNMSVPKFDVSSDIDLKNAMNSMGITSAFKRGTADFSPLTTDITLFLSRAQHAARVKIDEKGCEAAAYTVMIKDAQAADPPDEVDFVLDRPFMFAVSGKDGMPRFIGIVNNPF